MRYSFLAFLFFIFQLQAQYENRGWELGGRIGVSHYFGDLNTDFDISKPGIFLNGTGRYNFNNRISIAFLLNAARFGYKDSYSDNPFQQARNLSFRTDVLELENRIEFNFLNYIHGDIDRHITPYMHGGLSFLYFRPTATLDGERYNLRSLGTEGQTPGNEYFFIQPAITYGAGVKVDINYRWSINFDFSARILFSDYIDDVSGEYVSAEEILSIRGTNADVAVALADRSIPTDDFPQIGEAGRQRGNGKNDDNLMYLNVGVFYYFGKLRCPKVSPLY